MFSYGSDEHSEPADPVTPEATQDFEKILKASRRGDPQTPALLEGFLSKHPDSPLGNQVRLLLAHHQIKAGRSDQAQKWLKQIIDGKSSSRRAEALLLMARIHMANNEFDRCAHSAVEAATHPTDEETADTSPHNAGQILSGNARLIEGECLMLGGRYPAALKAFSTAYPMISDPELRRYAHKRVRTIVFDRMDGASASTIRGRIGEPLGESYLTMRSILSSATRGDSDLRNSETAAKTAQWLASEGERSFAEQIWLMTSWHQTMLQGGKPPIIGLLLPLEGNNRRIGWKMLWGGLLAAGALGDGTSSPVGLVIKNSGTTAEEAATAVRELAADDSVLGLVGPTDVRSAIGAASAAQKAGLPIISLTVDPTLPPRGSLVFRNFVDAPREVRSVLNYLETTAPAEKPVGVAILAPEIPYGKSMSDLFIRQAKERDINVVLNTTYPAAGFDYKEALEQLVACRDQVTAIFIPDTSKRVSALAAHLAARGFWSLPAGEAAPKIARGEAGVTPVQMLGTSAWYDPDLLQKAGRYLRGAVLPVGFFAEDDTPEVVDFVTNTLAIQDSPPDYLQAYAYDSILRTGKLLLYPQNRNREGLARALREESSIQGVTGTMGFNRDGNPLGELLLISIDDTGFIAAKKEEPLPSF